MKKFLLFLVLAAGLAIGESTAQAADNTFSFPPAGADRSFQLPQSIPDLSFPLYGKQTGVQKPVLDCQLSAGGWTYSAASFTAPGPGCVVSFSQTTPTTMFGADGLLTFGPNNIIKNSNSFAASGWNDGSMTFTTGIADPFGGTNATTIKAGTTFDLIQQTPAGLQVGTNYLASYWLRRRSGTGSVTIYSGATSGGPSLTSSWQQFYVVGAAASSTGKLGILLGTNGDQVDFYAPTYSAVTHETTPRPQDQVITGASAYYGPRDDNGCQYPTITNCGLLPEGASANEEPNARDMTQASWTKGATITVAHTATGIDGVANSANLITGGATTATNTVCGALTITSEAQTGSFYIEPVTVTGAINISINGGSTWTNIAGSLISSKFVRPSAEATLANPSLCVQIANNNDQIIVDANQVEDRTSPTSFIPTGASQVSRAADVDSQSVSAYNLQTGGALLVKAITPNNNVATQVFAALDDATTNNYVRLIYATNGHVEALIESGGSLQATIDLGAVANSTLIRVGVNFVGGQFAASLNGAAVVTASGTMPASLTTARYGMASSGSQLNSWIQRPQIYKAINNNQLQAKVAAL